MTNMNPHPTRKGRTKEFYREFTESHPGDSGIGGNTPQDPNFQWACGPEDMADFLQTALMEAGEMTVKQLLLDGPLPVRSSSFDMATASEIRRILTGRIDAWLTPLEKPTL